MTQKIENAECVIKDTLRMITSVEKISLEAPKVLSAAMTITSKSPIFKDLNLELGKLIDDDDSTMSAAVRSVSQHQVVKHSDKNHTSRGVKK